MWSRKWPPEEADEEAEDGAVARAADPGPNPSMLLLLLLLANLDDTSPFQERTLALDMERRPWSAPSSTSTSEPEDPSKAPLPPDPPGRWSGRNADPGDAGGSMRPSIPVSLSK